MSGATELEDRYRAMASEWTTLTAPEDEKVVERWERNFAALQQDQLALSERGLWFSGRGDLLGVIGRGRREVDHCAVLAWLLDPNMPHRLGTRFLRQFLRRCRPDRTFAPEELASARVRCEECREHGRADIVLRAGRLTVVVEAKIDHVERPSQCDDLFRDYGDEPGVVFVFLTPHRSRPTTASNLAASAFVCLSFREVRDDVRAVVIGAGELMSTSAARASIECYLQTLDAEFE